MPGPQLITQNGLSFMQRPDGSLVQVAPNALSPEFLAEYSAPASPMMADASLAMGAPSVMTDATLPPATPAPAPAANPLGFVGNIIADNNRVQSAAPPTPAVVQGQEFLDSKEWGVPSFDKGPTTAAASAQQPGVSMVQGKSRGGGGMGKTAKGILGTYDTQAQAVRKETGALAEGERQRSEQLGGMSVDLMMREEEQRMRAEKQQAFMADQNQKLAQLQQDAASAKEDPNRLFANASTGAKVTAALSVALGAIGGALRRDNGPNVAMQVINQAIDRDIAAQRTSIQQKQSAVENQRGLIASARQAFQDNEQQEAAMRDLYLQGAQMKLEGIMAGTKSAELQAKGESLLAELDRQRLGQQQKFQAAAARAAQQQSQYVVNVGGVPVAMSGKDYVAYTQKQQELGGSGSSKETMSKIQASDAAHERITGLIQRARAVRERVGGEALPTKEKAELESLGGQLDVAFKDMAQLGQLTDADYALVRKVIPELTDWDLPWRTNVLDKLNSLETTATATRNANRRAAGLPTDDQPQPGVGAPSPRAVQR